MTIPGIELKWVEFRQNAINWRDKRRDQELAKTARARERSIRILQTNRPGL